ncbi:MAG TPA: YbaB/EbfC family nucleoid-associated protein [Planctomycetota bacterium]|nr:YbaB/EbfC family nucleoid-associated protein [Planctomycetota bacterium]
MSGSFGEMGSLLKQAQEMQRELDRVRGELRAKTLEGSAGGGVVKVWVSGDRQVTKIEIAPEVIKDGDKKLLEDLVLAALRDGIGKATRLAEESLAKVTGGMNLPGLF